MSLPWVRLYTSGLALVPPSSIVSSLDAAATASRDEHVPSVRHPLVPLGSDVVLTMIVLASATPADASSISDASASATHPRRRATPRHSPCRN
jgi:hypothetical protein